MAALVNNAKLTFENEGSSDSGSKWYTRKPHHPDSGSGVTIGKGYDMLKRSVAKVNAELLSAGVDAATAKLLSAGAGLSGDKVEEFIQRPEIKDIELTEDQEILLFNLTYVKNKQYAQHLCQKADVVSLYGACDWVKVDAGIKEFVTDLTFRGDYTADIRSLMQKAIISNDYDKIIEIAKKKENFPGNLDNNRFLKRIQHLESAKIKFKSQNGKPDN